jgi:predicted amidohydrolase
MYNLSKPGYYIKESGNLLVFYDKNTFMDGCYSYDSYVLFKGKEQWVRVHFTDEDLKLLNICYDFEFVDEL